MKLRSTRHALPAETREKIVNVLNARLADLGDLRSQVKQAHWNIRGPRFIALHELFDRIVDDLDSHTDDVAERATALGGRALGTARLTAENSKLDELPKKATGDLDLVALLSERFAKASSLTGRSIQKVQKLDDEVTADLFIEITASLDKTLWFLEAHLDR